jgi:uroporphyrinogen decarboxylase
MVDFIGYAASVFVVLSFVIKDNLVYIRLTNMIGCVLFVIYGSYINSIPIILPNAFLVIVQLTYLYKARKDSAKNADNETVEN